MSKSALGIDAHTSTTAHAVFLWLIPQKPLDEKEIQRRIAEGKAWDDWYKWLNCDAPIMSKYNAQLKDFHRLGGEAFWAEVGARFGVFALRSQPKPLTTARPINTGSYRLLRLGDAGSNVLKIRCPLTKAAALFHGIARPLKVQ